MDKKNKRNIIKYIIVAGLVLLYVTAYVYQYSKAIKPDIRYYEEGTVIDNFGLSYKLSGEIYSKDEFIEEFGVEEYRLGGDSVEYEKKYIVVKAEITKTSDEIEEEPNDIRKMIIYSKYWQVGVEPDLTDILQKKAGVSIDNLKVGESAIGYNVFSIASCNLSKRLWENANKTTVWFEFTDTRTCPYVRRVRILN